MSNIAYETIFAIVETHTERIDEKKKKKNHCWISNANENSRLLSRCSRKEKDRGVHFSPHLFSHTSLVTRSKFCSIKLKKKNSITSKEIVPRCFARRLRTIVLTINFTTSLNIFNLRPFFLISFYLSNFLRS